MASESCCIDLGHNQRHSGVHAKRRGIVDDDRALPYRDRRPVPRRHATGGKQRQVDIGKAPFAENLNADIVVAERQHAPGRARRRKQPKLLGREIALREDVQ